MIYRYVRILAVLGMVAVLCGTASAGMGVVAETQVTSVMNNVGCPSPCECISESVAIQRWGGGAYEKCSKTSCGESSDAMVTYYCFRPLGSTIVPSGSCKAPCECQSESSAIAKWGRDGYMQCSKTSCGSDETTGGSVPRYCFRQWASTVSVATGTQAAAATTTTTAAPATSQAPAQATTPVQAPVTSAAVTPASSVSWPASDAVPQETPVGAAIVIAAIGTAVLAAGMLRPGNRQ